MESLENSDKGIIVQRIQDFCEVAHANNRQFHQHNYYSVYWIQKGNAEHSTAFASTPITAPAIFFIPQKQIHRMKLDVGCEGYGILFEGAVITPDNQGLLHSALFSSDIFSVLDMENGEDNSFQFYVSALQNELNHPQRHNRQAISNLLSMFLIEANRLFAIQNEQTAPAQNEDVEMVLHFRKLVEENFVESKDVSWYAEQLNVRPACLNDITKRATGNTAGELIRGRVINEAKRLLVNSTESGKSIAYELGFADPAYFSRFFKKYTGTTLKNYREQRVKMYHNSVV